MNNNPLLILESFGQSIWLDFLRRNALDNGEIQRLITFVAPGMISSLGILLKQARS